MSETFDCKNPASMRVLTLNASDDLINNEVLTGISSQTITVVRGIDPLPSLTISLATINVVPIAITTTQGVLVNVPAFSAVQCVADNGLDGVWYLVTFICTTSNPNKTMALTGILPVSAMC